MRIKPLLNLVVPESDFAELNRRVNAHSIKPFRWHANGEEILRKINSARQSIGMPILNSAHYIMDRGYLDFLRLHRIQVSSAFFVTRAKRNLQCQRRYSRPVDKTTGLRCDQTIVLTGIHSHQQYPDPIRRIGYFDIDSGKSFVFLTNNFIQPAITIPSLYRCRWQVELFFKWIKQHLRIKAFYGTSPNAVKTQVWIAISIYILVAIMRKRLKLSHSLYTILQILSLTLFEKMPVLQAFSRQQLPIVIPNNEKHLYLPGF